MCEICDRLRKPKAICGYPVGGGLCLLPNSHMDWCVSVGPKERWPREPYAGPYVPDNERLKWYRHEQVGSRQG